MTFDDYFIEMCRLTSKKSKDDSTKVGAVIVGPDKEVRTTGFNGFPRGTNDHKEKRHERPLKYRWFEHAERNAIYNAARVGIPLQDCKIYISFPPCADCARAIIQCGIKEVIIDKHNELPSNWNEDWKISKEMFLEAGVSFRTYGEKMVLMRF